MKSQSPEKLKKVRDLSVSDEDGFSVPQHDVQNLNAIVKERIPIVRVIIEVVFQPCIQTDNAFLNVYDVCFFVSRHDERTKLYFNLWIQAFFWHDELVITARKEPNVNLESYQRNVQSGM